MANLNDPKSTQGQLIAASKVNGTTVYDATGTKLGSIYDVMIDKVSGRTDYAILSFGGFLGIGEGYHPLPWNQLKYDTRLDGYIVNMDRSRLDGAPRYETSDLSDWDDQRRSDIDTYYGAGAGADIPGIGSTGLGSRDPANI
jgi:sporulation protein YlmC with PRC-barrel domain